MLSAVFVPMAFFSGSVGAIYRQFSLTVASAMLLSVLVAVVLTPALCATFLKPSHGDPYAKKGFFGWFNRGFDRTNSFYQSSVGHVIGRKWRYLLIYGLILVGLGLLFVRLPSSFLPNEDQGILFAQASLPAGATQERTQEVLDQMSRHFRESEADFVEGVFTVNGFSFSGRGQNSGLAFVRMKNWDDRDPDKGSVFAVARRAMGALSRIKEARIFAFAPPAIIALGNASGFEFQLLDRAGQGHEKLMAARNQLLGMAAKNPALMAVRPDGLEDNPQLKIDIDQEKASALQLSLSDINSTLTTTWGSSYVNDFIENGRVKKVYLMADAPFRMQAADLDRWYVRNSQGEMVPFSAFTDVHWIYGSPRLERYNGQSSRKIAGQPAPGMSTGAAMAEMEAMAAKLPPGFGYEWTGLSYEERLSGSQAPALYALSIIVVFLCLAALYESWAIPFAVILVVPLGILGAVIATSARGLSNDVFFQIGLLTTMGLAAKNAILIVEFAKELYEGGMDLLEATVHAARQRLRPIIMTSMAFSLGVLPLAIANGAGSGSQNAIGTGVLGGMISATVLAIFFVPLFFILILRAFTKKTPSTPPAPPSPGAAADAP